VGLTRRRCAAVLVGLAALGAAAAPAQTTVAPTGFAFGRTGGNIRPYTVAIANTGVVRSTGGVEVGKTRVTAAQLAALNRAATDATFALLPAATNCPGTLPDIAATFVRVGGRTVRVHGGCVPRYQRLLTALQAAVHLQR
jgi:hypothetical protein